MSEEKVDENWNCVKSKEANRMIAKFKTNSIVIPWYKMYDFVKSNPQDESFTSDLIVDYLITTKEIHRLDHDHQISQWTKSPDDFYVFDMTLSRWCRNATLEWYPTFGQIKESMDNYMDSQFREAGFEVYLP